MNYSKNYLIHPVNRFVERAIAGSLVLLGDDALEAATPDRSVTVADIFLFTRGNFEQHSFSTNVLEDLSRALEASITDNQRNEDPLTWGDAQNRLGNILATMGQQQHDSELFSQAAACFENALEVFDQEKNPAEWAISQYNLGTVKQALGELLDDAKLFNQATDAYTNALLVWNRDENPEEWMLTMHQLGASFHHYGRQLKGNRNLQKSVVAYKNALAVLNADDYALELTATHNNRGAVLHHLAEAEGNPERFEEALKSYQKGLTVCMEQQLPFHLAVIIRVNKTTAQRVLAELSSDGRLAEEVVDEFELILECFPHALQPLTVKHCQAELERIRPLATQARS